MSHSRRKTCRRFNVAGHAHSLTFSCFDRRKFLERRRPCEWLTTAIDRARDKHHFDLWAYVFMPEHVHLLIWPTKRNYNISRILSSMKLPVTRRSIVFFRKNAPGFLKRMEDRQPNGKVAYRFWQRGGGYDRNIDEPRTAHREIDYIHMNPVRRGLCTRPEDFVWSSAADWAGVRNGPLRIDRESLPPIGVFFNRSSR